MFCTELKGGKKSIQENILNVFNYSLRVNVHLWVEKTFGLLLCGREEEQSTRASVMFLHRKQKQSIMCPLSTLYILQMCAVLYSLLMSVRWYGSLK